VPFHGGRGKGKRVELSVLGAVGGRGMGNTLCGATFGPRARVVYLIEGAGPVGLEVVLERLSRPGSRAAGTF
jgi:hypothetical protein